MYEMLQVQLLQVFFIFCITVSMKGIAAPFFLGDLDWTIACWAKQIKEHQISDKHMLQVNLICSLK